MQVKPRGNTSAAAREHRASYATERSINFASRLPKKSSLQRGLPNYTRSIATSIEEIVWASRRVFENFHASPQMTASK